MRVQARAAVGVCVCVPVADAHTQTPLPCSPPRLERQWAAFSPLDACSYALNVYDRGATLSVVVDSGAHGTHVSEGRVRGALGGCGLMH